MLEKTYLPSGVEPRIYANWEKANAFAAGAGAREGKDSFCIVIPPPNVTGSLHMGHALNNTLQDILVRWNRMLGQNVLWQPGMDHAGIATQMVVERQLMEHQQPGRREMGREKFVKRIWDWKAESGGTILGQLKRLGASCDWSRERFTMDEGLSKAVLEVFVRLYEEGLIYKDKRLVNWDPKLLTAISDLEVEQREIDGHLWHFKYPIVGEEGAHITVATTRPETMLGDTAIAVHPQDERYSHLIGRLVQLPLVGRHIPIVADDYADPEAGSGAVKITPAHDFNDFEVGKRNNLPAINILAVDASIALRDNEDFAIGVPEHANATMHTAIEAYHGLDRFAARKKIVSDMDALGLLEKIDGHTHVVPHGDRGGVPIEPYLTDQWYVDAKTLAAPAIASVREGRMEFVPKNWDKTYFDWMENIQPWCISRQLWWGHQIPAWYGPDGKVFVAKSEAEAAEQARSHYGRDEELSRDEDVLDTWFSSALWPFSTLGWPDQTPELKTYYQTDVLITGFDIIFFWVARMMMMGLHFMDEEPFHTVYIHALVRDEHGAKMSKSKGNVVDPLDLIDQYGADALRFTLCAMAAAGRDIRLATSRVEGYRNFATKLWNVARFAEMNDCSVPEGFAPDSVRNPLNRWIITECGQTITAIDAALKTYRFNDAANVVYQFVWHKFADWFIELSKPALMADDSADKAEARAVVAWTRDEILKMLHPFMPFITEELWAVTGEADRDTMLITTQWPTPALEDQRAADDINWLIETISSIRSVRTEMNVPAAAKVDIVIVEANAETRRRSEENLSALMRMARLNSVEFESTIPDGSAQIIVGEAIVCMPLKGVIDIAAEKQRLEKDIGKVEQDIAKINGKLGNQKFVSRAPDDVVSQERSRLQEANEKRDMLTSAIKRLEATG
uniref:valine--tRNA ligase n=1 Tax=Pararhizobium sp. IMCC3301 TaxID=3067904 RepID=UPI0027422DBA|nr:valine--tRNA ligase [Pararhizobium sp. IMCC3301]